MDMNRVRPLGHWVLLKVDPPKEKSDSGLLYLPDGNLESRLGHSTATVLAAGPGKMDGKGKRQPMGISPGDRVLFRGYLQVLARPGGIMDNTHCIVHCDDIVLKIEES